jgi:hypothetical protein
MLAAETSAKDPNALKFLSKVVEGLEYDFGGRFRELCIRTCQMHNYERILSPIITNLMGQQGLAFDMTTAQNLYRFNYYMKKYRDMFNFLITKSVGGDFKDFNKAPAAIRNLIGQCNATRWLSMERTCHNLILTLEVEASEDLIIFIRDFFGGEDSCHWQAAIKYCKCINSDKLSFTMLQFYYLANHSPGGKRGEGLIGCMSVLGFLASPIHRISVFIM